MRSNFIFLIYVFAWLYSSVKLFAYAFDCTNSKQEWMRIRYTALVGRPISPNLGLVSDVCHVPESLSCCNRDMEREMYTLGQRQLIEQCNRWLQVARQMKNDSLEFEYLFQVDLEQAKSRLHQFFSRIYGYNYKLHRSFFFGFFTDLEQYMSGKRGQLGHLIDSFFNQLRDNIISLIERSGQVISNSAFASAGNSLSTDLTAFGTSNNNGVSATVSSNTNEASEAQRIRCLSDRVAQLKPFDEVDVRLRARMLEAYPPARMLVNILSVTSQLLFHLVDQTVARSECILGITRYRFCAACAGRSLSDVCPDSCSRLLTNCLQADGQKESQLAYIWPQLIDAILLSVTRLERSFNFPSVNRHLQMEISEAITSLQTRYGDTKSKFESECRLGSVNRRLPHLFSPVGQGSRTPVSQSNLANWPTMFKQNRDSRVKRAALFQKSSMASQELLDWQTRQRPLPHGTTHQSRSAFDQSMSPNWANPESGENSNIPDRIARQASQLKRTETIMILHTVTQYVHWSI